MNRVWEQDGVNEEKSYFFFFLFILFLFLSTCLHMTDFDHCGMSVSEVVVQMRVVERYLI